MYVWEGKRDISPFGISTNVYTLLVQKSQVKKVAGIDCCAKILRDFATSSTRPDEHASVYI